MSIPTRYPDSENHESVCTRTEAKQSSMEMKNISAFHQVQQKPAYVHETRIFSHKRCLNCHGMCSHDILYHPPCYASLASYLDSAVGLFHLPPCSRLQSGEMYNDITGATHSTPVPRTIEEKAPAYRQKDLHQSKLIFHGNQNTYQVHESRQMK